MAKVSLKRLPGRAHVARRRRRPVGGGRRRGGRRRPKKTTKRRRPRRRGRGALEPSKKKKLRQILPLLKTLQGVKPQDNRSVLLSHLDDEACEAMYETLYNVMANEKIGPATRKKLRKKLWAHQEPMNFLTKNGKRYSPKLKRKKLAAMGGNPLGLILSAAIPFITDLLLGKR
jgi:hypothetical protein